MIFADSTWIIATKIALNFLILCQAMPLVWKHLLKCLVGLKALIAMELFHVCFAQRMEARFFFLSPFSLPLLSLIFLQCEVIESVNSQGECEDMFMCVLPNGTRFVTDNEDECESRSEVNKHKLT